MARIAEVNVDFQRTMGEMKLTLTEMRSDILLVENLNWGSYTGSTRPNSSEGHLLIGAADLERKDQ